jgi:succinyl-diaminopimelate desuccinylase
LKDDLKLKFVHEGGNIVNHAQTWMEKHEKEFVEDICELVRIPSISLKSQDPEAPFGIACREALDASLRLGERMGFVSHNHENYCGSLTWQGKSDSEIGFFGHTDVVPAGEGWTYDPFAPVVKDGMIIGRGASDNKGSFMAALYALRYLKETGYEPRHTMRFFLGCNEEKGMEDVIYYAQTYKEPVFSIVPDVKFPVCNGEKGVLEIQAECRRNSEVLVEFTSGVMSNAVPAYAKAVLKLTKEEAEALKKAGAEVKPENDAGWYIAEATGIPAHAAFPEGSVSAEVKLAGILLRSGVLDDNAKVFMEAVCTFFSDYYGKGLGIDFEDEISGKLTHVGGIAVYKDGIFHQDVNIRYNITADYDQMIANIRSAFAEYGFEMIQIHDSKPCYTSADDVVVKKLVEIANRELNMDLKAYVMGGGTYARKLNHAVGFGPGIPAEKRFGTERGGAHQADEYAEIQHLKQAFLIYVEAIRALDELVEIA